MGTMMRPLRATFDPNTYKWVAAEPAFQNDGSSGKMYIVYERHHDCSTSWAANLFVLIIVSADVNIDKEEIISFHQLIFDTAELHESVEVIVPGVGGVGQSIIGHEGFRGIRFLRVDKWG